MRQAPSAGAARAQYVAGGLRVRNVLRDLCRHRVECRCGLVQALGRRRVDLSFRCPGVGRSAGWSVADTRGADAPLRLLLGIGAARARQARPYPHARPIEDPDRLRPHKSPQRAPRTGAWERSRGGTGALRLRRGREHPRQLHVPARRAASRRSHRGAGRFVPRAPEHYRPSLLSRRRTTPAARQCRFRFRPSRRSPSSSRISFR